MSNAQDFVTSFMTKLAGTATLTPALQSVFAKILANQVEVAANGEVTFKPAFANLSEIFTFIATPAADRPAGPLAYTDADVAAAKTAAATDTGLTVGGDAPVGPELPTDEPTEEPGVEGETFTLTTGTDLFTGTTNDDTFTGALGTLQDADVIIDATTTDNDVLNVAVTTAALKPRIQNIENVNVTGEYITTGLDLSQTSGVKTLTVNTKIAAGEAKVTEANSINAAKIVAGDNIKTLNVASLASGTRDVVEVVGNKASTINLTGSAGPDQYKVSAAKNATLNLATLATTGDVVTVDAAGDLTIDAGVAANNAALDLNINANTENVKVTLSDATNINAEKMALDGSKNITLKVTDGVAVSGTFAPGAQYDGTAITKAGSGVTTLEISALAGSAITAGNDFSRAAVDVVELSGAAAGVAGITLNSNTKLNLTEDVGANLTVGLDHGDKFAAAFTQGTLNLNVSKTQGAAIITDATVETVLVEATPAKAIYLDQDENGFNETSLSVADIQLDATTNAIVVQGAQNLVLDKVTVNADDQVVAATNMTGNLTISQMVGAFDATLIGGKGHDSITTQLAQVYDIQTGDGNDYVDILTTTAAAAGTEVDTGAGDDWIQSSSNVTVINAGAGNDTVITGGKDTITLGEGADTVKLDDNLADVLVKDFVKGTDTIELIGVAKAGTDVDLTKINEVAAGVYSINDTITSAGAGVWQITLENNGTKLTATDLSDSIALDITAADGKSVVAGSKNDKVTVAAGETATITTGAGSDTVIIEAGAGTEATVKDFTVGTDKVVVTGTITADISVNLNNVAAVAGKYTIGDAVLGQNFILQNAGKNIVTEDNLTNIVQLGSSATVTFDVDTSGSAVSVTGGEFDDFVKLADTGTQGAVFNYSNNGGVDTVVSASGDGTAGQVSFKALTGISYTAATDVAADAAKIADATDGGVYVFADSSNGAGSSKITTFVKDDTANGITQDTINTEVAAFINAALGVSAGETYVVVINDQSTATYATKAWGSSAEGYNYDAYAYLVTGDADGVQADNIKLIGHLDDGSGAAAGAFDGGFIA